MKLQAVLVVAFICVSCVPVSSTLISDHQGGQFFEGFDFFTGQDPTHGFVEYVDRTTAWTEKLIQITNKGQVIMKADDSSVATDRGRKSVRISSKKIYNSGLFILDAEHAPTGCAVWPAFWTHGPDWPNKGEIDVIEYVNNADANHGTLHTKQGCKMDQVSLDSFKGYWSHGSNGKPSSDCYINAPGQYTNQGCGIGTGKGSAGAPFNIQKGGVYAFNWNPSTGIKMWYFPRSLIPSDITSGNPNIKNWGKPFGNFEFGPNCPSSYFADNKVIFNITFCGDWAGNVMSTMCPEIKTSCYNHVKYNFKYFSEAYWTINYLRVYSPQ